MGTKALLLLSLLKGLLYYEDKGFVIISTKGTSLLWGQKLCNLLSLLNGPFYYGDMGTCLRSFY